MSKVFVDGPLVCIDFACEDGRSQITRESLEQIRQRYPHAELVEFEPWLQAKEKALCTPVEEITRAQSVLYSARLRRRAAWKRIQALRKLIRDHPLGSGNLRLHLIRASDTHREALRLEAECKAIIEKRAALPPGSPP